jgi:hypothetical protein
MQNMIQRHLATSPIKKSDKEKQLEDLNETL